MSGLPSGNVTFLFTDIEGSTRRWERHPGAMQAAVERHDALLRQAIEANRGYVFKTVGDAFCAAFPTAQEALQAVVDAQHAVSAEEWAEVGPIKVRMALHTGTTQERDGDYFGPPVNRVARILSAAYGGQTLLSLATEQLVCDSLPPGATLRDLGEHRLKDLTRPEHIYDLVIPGLPADFPTIKTLDSRPNNLPAQPTTLIGRERELAAAGSMLLQSQVRLLSMTGPGGIGKSRLSLQVAADMLDSFEDGVFFVPLAPITDSELVPSTIAGTLGILEAGGRPLLDSIKDFLREKKILLVIDNFEQVTDAAPVVADLLLAAPGLKILVTTRSLLRVRGEHDFPVPPLALPDPKQRASVEELLGYDSVRLFVDRAAALKPDFALSAENSRTVSTICARLDGLPLAIELAAARIRLLTPQAMLQRLESRLKLLTGGARDLPERQQTLRGAIEWSHDLLSEEDKTFFRRVSAFVGGTTLEAAEAVCLLDDGPGVDVLAQVESLVDKSLLRQEEDAQGDPRFTMLETIREYALEKLMESGEGDEILSHHAQFYLEMAKEADPHLRGPKYGVWFSRLEREHDNMRASLDWALATGETIVALRIEAALWWFWFTHGHLSEGRKWLLDTLERAGDTSKEKAAALYAAGNLLFVQGDYNEAHELHESSLNMARQLGDERSTAMALNGLGLVAGTRGDYDEKRRYHEEALDIFRTLKEKWGLPPPSNTWVTWNRWPVIATLLGRSTKRAYLYSGRSGIKGAWRWCYSTWATSPLIRATTDAPRRCMKKPFRSRGRWGIGCALSTR